MLTSPFVRQPVSVQQVMFTVLVALLPAVALYVWQFGPGIVVNLAIASISAVAGEAFVLWLRKKPVTLYVTDLSAVVTAWLIVLAFPPTIAAWVLVLATIVAIVLVKHLYGGLGQNLFNPAMAAYCLMIVAYPSAMSQWPEPGWIDLGTHLQLITGGGLDAVSGATPLDTMRTGLHADQSVSTILQSDAFGLAGGRGWEWIALGYLLGGAFLLWRRVITWHLPTAFLVGLLVISGVFWMADSARFASPLFHLASGGTMIAAFFIVTDPVSGATTPRGKLIFAASIALITYLIRAFGAYPDGIAFAVLLMNVCVPLIDMKTQPPVFGHKKDNGKGESVTTEYTATRTSIRTGAILTIFAIGFTAVMALTYRVTKPDIDAAVAEVKRKLIAEVLPPASYDNALLSDVVMLHATQELGLDEGGLVYRARKSGEPVALIVEARAPDGYGGAVDLIVAVRADGSISGVRTTAHKETPGLGDYVDRRKDSNTASPWIDQFAGASYADTPAAQWQVRKDGGSFDARTGATISARAVVGAVARALTWTNENQNRLFDAKAGEALATASGASKP